MAVPSLPAQGNGKPGTLEPNPYRETRYATPAPVAIITMSRTRPRVNLSFPALLLLRRMEGLRPAYESDAIYQFMIHHCGRRDRAVMDSIGLCIQKNGQQLL